jgi:hypothetical protein
VRTWNLKEPVEDVKRKSHEKNNWTQKEGEDNWTMNNFKCLLST